MDGYVVLNSLEACYLIKVELPAYLPVGLSANDMDGLSHEMPGIFPQNPISAHFLPPCVVANQSATLLLLLGITASNDLSSLESEVRQQRARYLRGGYRLSIGPIASSQGFGNSARESACSLTKDACYCRGARYCF